MDWRRLRMEGEPQGNGDIIPYDCGRSVASIRFLQRRKSHPDAQRYEADDPPVIDSLLIGDERLPIPAGPVSSRISRCWWLNVLET